MKTLWTLFAALLLCGTASAQVFDFPNTPTTNQIVTGPFNQQYKWDGAKWVQAPASNVALPVNNPTFTGTMNGANLILSGTSSFTGAMTFPDGSTYTTAGHNNMLALGIGIAAPTSAGGLFSALRAFNGNTTMLLANTNAGTGAAATMYFNNDKSAPNPAGSYGAIQFTSSAYTASGPNELSDAFTILSGGAGGIEVVAAGNPGVKIGNQSYPQVNIGTASGGVGGIYIGDSSGGALTTLPTDAVDIIQNFNGGTDIVVRNNSTGASAQALVSLQNSQSGVSGQMGLTGHGSTFGGAYPPDTFYVQSTGSGGLALLSNAAGTPIDFWVGGGNHDGRFVNWPNQLTGLVLPGFDGFVGPGASTAGLVVGGEYFLADNWAQLTLSGGAYFNQNTGQWIYDGGGGSGINLFRVGTNGLQFYMNPGAASGTIVTTWNQKLSVGGYGPEITTMVDSQAAPWGPAPSLSNGSFSVGAGNSFGYINPTAWPVTLTFGRALPHNAVCVANLLGAAGLMWTLSNSTTSISFSCNTYGGGPACALGWFSYHCAGI